MALSVLGALVFLLFSVVPASTELDSGSLSLADRLWGELDLGEFQDVFGQLRFCFDVGKPHEVLELLRETLPTEVVLSSDGDDADAVCSDWDRMSRYVCREEEDYIMYFQFVLQTDDPEKIPETRKCGAANMSQSAGGCHPGFFQAGDRALPCCEGFFCPQMMTCMIPCPVGANCPKAQSRDVPQSMLRGLDTPVVQRTCAPYGYQERWGMECGGAHKWAVSPHHAFFPVNDTRGHIYCPKGYYCEDTVQIPERCHKGYYCREGSVKPSRCPFMTICPAGASLPEDYFGLAFDGVFFVLLVVMWQASKYYNRILRRLSSRERVRILWGMHTSWDIVPQTAGSSEGAVPSESVHAKGPHGTSDGRSFLPKLVALQTFSSTISRTFTRSRASNAGVPEQGPAVWASLSHELRPRVDVDDASSPRSQDHLIEDLNYAAITIEFFDLGLKVRTCGKLVVSRASGRFESSKLTVVMGPSGCGKTSLLSFLACQGDYTMASGCILINGSQTTLRKYRKVTGFVPQDDIIHPKLTVEENLLFSARYRLPKRTNRRDILAVVDRAIHLLGLVDVRNQQVGDEECRGISGGQRKRVNIGLELVADPWILFLDEPTSGLDATSCHHILSALSKIAHMGVTCTAVVHQPSNRVVKMFDDVLLLGKSGTTVYYGPQQMLRSYFMSLGFGFPEHENPADVYLDIITRPKRAPVSPNRSLPDIWESHEFHQQFLPHPPLHQTHISETDVSRHAANTVLEETGFIARCRNTTWMILYLLVSPVGLFLDTLNKAMQAFPIRRRHRGYWRHYGDGSEDEDLRTTGSVTKQFWLCFYRCTLERSRSALRIFVEYALYALSGMLLGILSDARASGRLAPFVSDMNYNIVAIALMTTIGSLRTFSQNQLLFNRESRSGLNKLAYCCATALFGDAGSILKGLCYLSLYYSYAQPRARFKDMFLVTVCVIYSCCGFGYLISKVLKTGPAQLTAAVFVLSNALLTRGRSSGLVTFIRFFLYHRWALEAYIISEAKQLFGVWSLERCATLQLLDYDIRHFATAIIRLVLLGVMTRFLAFVAILFGVRDKSD